MATVSMNSTEKVPANIVKWAKLENTVKDLLDTFEAGEQRNAELINRFFDQPIFYWEESFIDKVTAINPDIKFDDIKFNDTNIIKVPHFDLSKLIKRFIIWLQKNKPEICYDELLDFLERKDEEHVIVHDFYALLIAASAAYKEKGYVNIKQKGEEVIAMLKGMTKWN